MMNLNANFNIPDSIISACCHKIQDGFLFEKFCKSILNSVHGVDFKPVGGIHDGGQDSFVYQDGNKRIIYQFSIRKDWKTKIKQTIERLKTNENLRDISFSIIYFTNVEISQSEIDKFQIETLSNSSIQCLIHDNSKLKLEINAGEKTRSIFIDFCTEHAVFTQIENQVTDVYGSSGFDKTLLFLKHFIKDEVDSDYLEMLVRTHLFISLSDTDPDKGNFKKLDEIIAYITEQIPNLGKDFVSECVSKILKRIDRKQRDDREIRNHSDSGYCLAYTKRLDMQRHISSDAILIDQFESELDEKISLSHILLQFENSKIKSVIRKVVTTVFKNQGIEISSSIQNPSSSYHSANLKEVTQSIISKELGEGSDAGKTIIPIFDMVYNIFWRPTNTQKKFCQSLAKTFSLLFLGKADQQVIKHLKMSASGLRLLLGTDIIIKIFAEIHLPNELQRFTNLIRNLKSSSVHLMVNESTVKEAAAHIRSSVVWYDSKIKPFVSDAEHDDQLKDVLLFEERFSGKILVRAFYHAKQDGKAKTFDNFIENFVGPHQNNYYKDITDYLKAEFSVELIGSRFEDVDPDYQQVLKFLTKAENKNEIGHSRHKILENDAKVITTAYKLRDQYPITSADFILPAKVWWLTFESKTQKIKPQLEEKFQSLPNINPIVVISLLSNLNLLGTKSDTFDAVLGSAIGINMSHSVPDELIESLTTSYQAITELNKGKKAQMMRRIFDDLQAGHFAKITGVFDDYFSEVRKNWLAIEKIKPEIDKSDKSLKSIWQIIDSIEKNPLKKVIIVKEVLDESLPTTLAELKKSGLEAEVLAFLQMVEKESLSKYNV